MLPNWTEFDTIRIEQTLLARRLDAAAEHLGYNDGTARQTDVIGRVRQEVAAGMVALAGRIAPTRPVNQPRPRVVAGA